MDHHQQQQQQQTIKNSSSSRNNNKNIVWNPSWKTKFELLKIYYKENGHCNVPQRGHDNDSMKTLAKWVKRQRERYSGYAKPGKKKPAGRPITQEEIQALEGIEFRWRMKLPDIWNARYSELQEFVNKYKHAWVPGTMPVLGVWVQNQRRQMLIKEEGKPTALTPARIRLLNQVEFLWKPQLIRLTPWDTFYQQLQEFLNNVAATDVLNDPANTQEEVVLKHWLRNQLVQYERFLNGVTTKGTVFSLERAEKLTALGLDLPTMVEAITLLPHEEQHRTTQKVNQENESQRAKRIYIKRDTWRTRPVKRQKVTTTTTTTQEENASRNENPGLAPAVKTLIQQTRTTSETTTKMSSVDEGTKTKRHKKKAVIDPVAATATATATAVTAKADRTSGKKRSGGQISSYECLGALDFDKQFDEYEVSTNTSSRELDAQLSDSENELPLCEGEVYEV
mmetsp:Transcript_39425/g.45407  ORF Transcript_39425/g.45407 Transcript_39425/m.45407 type:complete len:451 (+) Transcript_39425:132-1484(+)